MTRPMPGPPEPDTLVQDHPDGGVVATRRVTEADGVPVVYFAYAADKHLTDAECAAEMWRERAEWWAGTYTKGPTAEDVDIRRAATWERFATHPHAFKENHND